MYPNTKIVFNICPHAMIGKLFIGEKGYKQLNIETVEDIEEEVENFDAGREFFEHITTGNIFKVGERWFNLPSLTKIINKVEKKYPKPNKFIIPKPKTIFKHNITVEVKSV